MEEFSINQAEVSLTVANTLFYASFLSPISGILIDKYGVKIVIRIGIIIMALIYAFILLQAQSKPSTDFIY